MFRGVNLAPTRGNSNTGSFVRDQYYWSYLDQQEWYLSRLRSFRVQSLRIPVNVVTAQNATALLRMRSFAERATGGRVVIVMFDSYTDTSRTDEELMAAYSHGDGKVNSVSEFAAAWAAAHAVFRETSALYEILNEPFGYGSNAREYVREMERIIALARLPRERCILDGLKYAENVKGVAAAGWDGLLGYHYYPFYLKTSEEWRHEERMYSDISPVADRVVITEFGADLRLRAEDVACIRGMAAAVARLRGEGRGVLGAYQWHGWHNHDNYDLWDAENREGAELISWFLEGFADEPPLPPSPPSVPPLAPCPADTWSPSWAESPTAACDVWAFNERWGALQGGRTLAEACGLQWAGKNCAGTCCRAVTYALEET